jgi:hypothetical protein
MAIPALMITQNGGPDPGAGTRGDEGKSDHTHGLLRVVGSVSEGDRRRRQHLADAEGPPHLRGVGSSRDPVCEERRRESDEAGDQR